MADLKGFRKANGLTQAEVASYLGVSEPFISRVEAGRDPLPDDKLDKLICNNKGWDVTQLKTVSGAIVVSVAPNRRANNESWEQKKIAMLEERIRFLEDQNKEYWELIKKLSDR